MPTEAAMKNDSTNGLHSIADTTGEINREKLLIPGYAGRLNDSELEYIKKALQNDPKLRTKWGFTRGRKRLSKKKIKLIAMYGIKALRNGSSF